MTPNYWPLMWKQAMILTMTKATQKIETVAAMMFPVATSKMRKAKITAMITP
jgi:hypothetical protein